MTPKSKTSERRAPRSWMITALLASLAVAYVTFVLVPAQAEITALRGRLNERRQHILQANGLALPVGRAAEQLTKTREVSAAWRKAAPSPSELSTCFASLSAEAQAAGVSIERFDPHSTSDMQALAQHGVAVHFRGGFPQAFDFLRRIEELPATIWLPSLRLTSDRMNGATPRGELVLTIFVDRTDSAE
jgi:Tfp pilus assembly protein PilO